MGEALRAAYDERARHDRERLRPDRDRRRSVVVVEVDEAVPAHIVDAVVRLSLERLRHELTVETDRVARWIPGDPAAALVVEFTGDAADQILDSGLPPATPNR